MSICPVMSMFATELDCLRARDKWFMERVAQFERENEAFRKDAERFNSLHWHYEQDRDMGTGGRWWASVSTNDPKIRSDKLAVIDAALQEQRKK